MNIGEKLKALRREKRLTLEDVSKSVDISRANINKYENGNITNIPSDKIEALARYYDVSPAYLMGWEERHPLPRITHTVSTSEAAEICGGVDQMPKEQREQALRIMKSVFTQYFEDDK